MCKLIKGLAVLTLLGFFACESTNLVDSNVDFLSRKNVFMGHDFHEFSPTEGGDLPDVPTKFTFDYHAFLDNGMQIIVRDTVYYSAQDDDTMSAYVIIYPSQQSPNISHFISVDPVNDPPTGVFLYDWWFSEGSANGLGSDLSFDTDKEYAAPFSVELGIEYRPDPTKPPTHDKYYRTFVFVRDQ